MNKRNTTSMVALVVSVLAVTVAIGAAPSIKWGHDFDKAAKDAKKSKTPILVDFYTNWCGWCKKLDKDTYSDKGVVDLSRKFVCVKVDGDKFPQKVKDYKVDGYPTIVFLNSGSKEVRRIVGYEDADKFLEDMQAALKKAK